MAVWAVGDVQGCFLELDSLLERIGFSPGRDQLWFVGDLVNRGPASLEVLRFVAGLGDDARVALGNHDLHLLAIARGGAKLRGGDRTLQPILDAPDRERLLDWLQSRALLHHDDSIGWTMVHAALPPQWDIALAHRCAAELESALRGEHSGHLLGTMYGNQPDRWRNDLEGDDRLRFIVNALTRLRVCDSSGRMMLEFKGPLEELPSGALPWFRAPGRRWAGARIVCGHWSALGYVNENGVLGLDTGCVWGGTLTAQRLDVAATRIVVPSTLPSRF
jgi:bis(5'-nucleosyl)-tetraphosphatase (symmetrical)